MNPQTNNLHKDPMQKLIARPMDFRSPRSLGKRLLVSQNNHLFKALSNLNLLTFSLPYSSVSNPRVRPQPSDYKDLEPNQNDRSVKIIDGALKIDNIQKSHEGYYICKASNGIGGISAVAKVSVQGISLKHMYFILLSFESI